MKTLWVAIAYTLIVACSPAQVPSRPTLKVDYHNSHWQKHQNDKLAICYAKMETMEAVTFCLLRLGVFI